MPNRHLHSNSFGFSVVELMVAVAVLAIIVGIGMPSFQSMLEKSRLDSAAEAMADSFRYARSEAIARNEEVESEGSYQSGWSVSVVSTGEELRVYDAFPANVTTDNNAAVSFNGRGMVSDGEEKAFSVSYSGGGSRCVQIFISGAVRLTNGACP
ncbi:GspH/FimT family pseudopilin [Marinobacterium sp. AK62]|uniref:Type II secretion system protein H n=1 Tax=Marinobacterium alkalitolerans TaxID=1542925 RepID=A0ABS3ZC26_9GAMM|nr:GspH/FimT family pseudopilin [Marinobacterium alkalitolerans]MBP0048870.1 GspH/FimT family pseudopilin [Marinobacterium alkalitolerans]